MEVAPGPPAAGFRAGSSFPGFMAMYKKWDDICKDISDSDEDDTPLSRIETKSPLERKVDLIETEDHEFSRKHDIVSKIYSGAESKSDFPDSPLFFILKAHNTILLKSRDPKTLNNALSAIHTVFSELDSFQGFLFSKYTLLPILVLLREENQDRLKASAILSRQSTVAVPEQQPGHAPSSLATSPAAATFSDRTVELALLAATAVVVCAGISGAEGLDLMQAATRTIIEPGNTAPKARQTTAYNML
jgi:hypothetical protein